MSTWWLHIAFTNVSFDQDCDDMYIHLYDSFTVASTQMKMIRLKSPYIPCFHWHYLFLETKPNPRGYDCERIECLGGRCTLHRWSCEAESVLFTMQSVKLHCDIRTIYVHQEALQCCQGKCAPGKHTPDLVYLFRPHRHFRKFILAIQDQS